VMQRLLSNQFWVAVRHLPALSISNKKGRLSALFMQQLFLELMF
jgi:hypothetical protein